MAIHHTQKPKEKKNKNAESATAVGTDERPVKKPSGLYNRRRNETKKERSETLDRRQPKTIRDRLEKEEEGVRIKKKKGGETGSRDVKSTPLSFNVQSAVNLAERC
ncbi:hypothetical protein BHM03_00016431 [Ensete ventricosum]|nr:hypothetical protein BHM03_00016431 [Ensete ventricosum]